MSTFVLIFTTKNVFRERFVLPKMKAEFAIPIAPECSVILARVEVAQAKIAKKKNIQH